jgi:hypothetical protein
LRWGMRRPGRVDRDVDGGSAGVEPGRSVRRGSGRDHQPGVSSASGPTGLGSSRTTGIA